MSAPSEPSEPSDRDDPENEVWPYEEGIDGQSVAAPEVRGRGLSSLQPFHHRNYLLLWSGGMVSVIGSWMQTVAVGALVVAHTGSATWAVVIAAGGFLPIGLLSPISGALADRIARRPALVAGNLLAGAVALAIALLVAASRDSPVVLTLLVTLQGCVSAAVGPFQQAILPDLVPPSEFLAAASLNSAQFNLGRVIGPALAGATIAAFGYPVAFVANAVSFLAVVVALFFIHLAPPPGPADESGLLESLRVGVRRGSLGTWMPRGDEHDRTRRVDGVPVHRPRARDGSSPDPQRSAWDRIGDRPAHDGPGLGCRRRRGRDRSARTSLRERKGAHRQPRPAPAGARSLRLRPVPRFRVAGTVAGRARVHRSSLRPLHRRPAPRPAEVRGRVLSLYLVALGVSYPIGSLAQGPLADRLGLAWTTAGTAILLAIALAVARVLRPQAFHALTDPSAKEVSARAVGGR